MQMSVFEYFILPEGWNRPEQWPNSVLFTLFLHQHFFTSFGARDRTYMMMFRLWQNALLDKVMLDGIFMSLSVLYFYSGLSRTVD